MLIETTSQLFSYNQMVTLQTPKTLSIPIAHFKLYQTDHRITGAHFVDGG